MLNIDPGAAQRFMKSAGGSLGQQVVSGHPPPAPSAVPNQAPPPVPRMPTPPAGLAHPAPPQGRPPQQIAQANQNPTPQNPPPGARPEEVADTIPARLSENEYVVPADVVRWVGLRELQAMREDAKHGLAQMEQDGLLQAPPPRRSEPLPPREEEPPPRFAQGGLAEPDSEYEYPLEEDAQRLAEHGINGDTLLAHINPEEAQLLKEHGGSGTRNPYTGLLQFEGDGGGDGGGGDGGGSSGDGSGDGGSGGEGGGPGDGSGDGDAGGEGGGPGPGDGDGDASGEAEGGSTAESESEGQGTPGTATDSESNDDSATQGQNAFDGPAVEGAAVGMGQANSVGTVDGSYGTPGMFDPAVAGFAAPPTGMSMALSAMGLNTGLAFNAAQAIGNALSGLGLDGPTGVGTEASGTTGGTTGGTSSGNGTGGNDGGGLATPVEAAQQAVHAVTQQSTPATSTSTTTTPQTQQTAAAQQTPYDRFSTPTRSTYTPPSLVHFANGGFLSDLFS